jgi:hypothetical protein
MHTNIEVITPAACMDLTVLETAKAELGILPSDTSQDDRIGVLIKQASGIVADYCDDIFGEETVVETFWADHPWEWARSFMLSRGRVTNIVSVVIDGMTLDPSTYRVGSDGFLYRIDTIGSCYWTWMQTAVITYTAGYVLLDDLPYGIERAALLLIKNFHFTTAQDPATTIRSEDIPGVRSVSYGVVGGSSSSSSGSLPSDVVALLAPYKQLAFA